MIVETDINTYERLKEQIPEIMPEIKVNLIVVDKALMELGFSQDLLCTIELVATDEQLANLRDICIQYEVDAFNTSDDKYPSKNDPYYLKYVRYSWIADWLYNIKKKQPL